jgi:hypothetical protein
VVVWDWCRSRQRRIKAISASLFMYGVLPSDFPVRVGEYVPIGRAVKQSGFAPGHAIYL